MPDLPSYVDLTWLWALLAGAGVLALFWGLVGSRQAATRRRLHIPEQDRFRGGAGAGARWAYDLAPSGRGADRITRLLKGANWYWGPGQAVPPHPEAQFHTVRGYYAAALYQAALGGVVGLLSGGVLAYAAALPWWVAGVGTALGGYLGTTLAENRLVAAYTARRHDLLVELAFRLPQLAAMAQTGASFRAIFIEVTSRPGGPFVTELARLLRLYEVTQSLEAAVTSVAQYARFQPLTEFLNQVLLVEARGGARAPALEVLATNAQAQLERGLEARAAQNARSMNLPVVSGAFFVTLLLLIVPILYQVMLTL